MFKNIYFQTNFSRIARFRAVRTKCLHKKNHLDDETTTYICTPLVPNRKQLQLIGHTFERRPKNRTQQQYSQLDIPSRFIYFRTIPLPPPHFFFRLAPQPFGATSGQRRNSLSLSHSHYNIQPTPAQKLCCVV